MVGEIDSKIYTLLRLNSNNVNFSRNGNTVSIYKTKVDYDITKEKVIIKVCAEGLIKEIDSKIDLEYPITNYLYKNNMYIQGWALTNCKNANLVIKIDGCHKI